MVAHDVADLVAGRPKIEQVFKGREFGERPRFGEPEGAGFIKGHVIST
jgi:hypothetical protein